MKLRRGFKTEATQIAREARVELGIHKAAPLGIRQLAEHLDIPILPMTRLSNAASPAVEYFSREGRASFSGVTVFDGSRRLIVYNDIHHPGRQASDLSHEIAHALLLHPPTPAIDDKGCRFWDAEIEDEAEWLSGTLLVPEEATLTIVRRGLTIREAALEYGVTEKMMGYRIDVTAARKRVARADAVRN